MRLTEANAPSSNRLLTMISSASVAMISSSTLMVVPMNVGKKRKSLSSGMSEYPFRRSVPSNAMTPPATIPGRQAYWVALTLLYINSQ